MEFNVPFNSPDFTVNRFSPVLLKKMEKYLKDRVYNQNEAIDSIINVFKSRIIPTNDLPLVLMFNWTTGIWKSYTAHLLSEFLLKETWEYDLYEISCNSYNSAEFSSLWWSSSWYSKEWDKAIMEWIVEKMYQGSWNWWIIVYLTEVWKVSTNSNIKSWLNDVLKKLMQNFESRIHNFKGGSSLWNIAVDTTNIIYILDDNLLETNLEYSSKIWFNSKEELEKDKKLFKEKNKITRENLINYLQKELEPSIFNRLNQSKHNIIQFNSIDLKFVEKIFNSELNKLEASFREYIIDLNKFEKYISNLKNNKSRAINEMLKQIDVEKHWGRSIRNYIHNELKIKILDEIEWNIKYI